MKNCEEKLKQLETALINHENLIIDLGDNCKYRLIWNEKTKNYRGKSLLSGIELGIWEIETLLDYYKKVEVDYGNNSDN